jgi:hypothetical protein
VGHSTQSANSGHVGAVYPDAADSVISEAERRMITEDLRIGIYAARHLRNGDQYVQNERMPGLAPRDDRFKALQQAAEKSKKVCTTVEERRFSAA